MSQDVSRMKELLNKGFFQLDNDDLSELAKLYAGRVQWLLDCEDIVLREGRTTQVRMGGNND